MKFIDIAGLVKGASQGQGLGNQFLGHIRSVDGIAHVVRVFENSDVVHVAGRVDPAEDLDVINTELMLADLEMLEKRRDKAHKIARSNDADAKLEYELIKSLITGREYSENNCVYVTNMLQAQRYLSHLGPQYLLDILYTGTYRKDSLVFVFERCPETRKAKELWDNHELN